MALTIGDNFSYLGAKPLDGRLKYATLADMVAMSASTLYDGIIAYCAGEDKNYQWKSSNTSDPTLGKWRELEAGGSSSLAITGTLLASGWNASNQQTLTFTGISNNTNGILTVPMDATSAQKTAYDGAGIEAISQSGTSITFSAKVVPTIDLPVVLITM